MLNSLGQGRISFENQNREEPRENNKKSTIDQLLFKQVEETRYGAKAYTPSAGPLHLVIDQVWSGLGESVANQTEQWTTEQRSLSSLDKD